MGGTSIVHWFIVLAFMLVIYVIPAVVILRKAGFSGWWCLLGFVPIVNIIMIWVFALADWPNLRKPPG